MILVELVLVVFTSCLYPLMAFRVQLCYIFYENTLFSIHIYWSLIVLSNSLHLKAFFCEIFLFLVITIYRLLGKGDLVQLQ